MCVQIVNTANAATARFVLRRTVAAPAPAACPPVTWLQPRRRFRVSCRPQPAGPAMRRARSDGTTRRMLMEPLQTKMRRPARPMTPPGSSAARTSKETSTMSIAAASARRARRRITVASANARRASSAAAHPPRPRSPLRPLRPPPPPLTLELEPRPPLHPPPLLLRRPLSLARHTQGTPHILTAMWQPLRTRLPPVRCCARMRLAAAGSQPCTYPPRGGRAAPTRRR